jgi:hypothetical protein
MSLAGKNVNVAMMTSGGRLTGPKKDHPYHVTSKCFEEFHFETQ